MIKSTQPPAAAPSKAPDPEAIRNRLERKPDSGETNPARSNTLPPVVVEILEPQDGTIIPTDTIDLRASASDGSTNFGHKIRWHSNVDGFLGRRRVVKDVTLSHGEHTLSATIRLPANGAAKGKAQRSMAAAGDEIQAFVTVCIDPVGYPDCDV